MEDIRGNVDTRIRKALDPAGPYDAIVLAYAGLQRLGKLDMVRTVLNFDEMLPAPGQGVLGVQCRDESEFESDPRKADAADGEHEPLEPRRQADLGAQAQPFGPRAP